MFQLKFAIQQDRINKFNLTTRQNLWKSSSCFKMLPKFICAYMDVLKLKNEKNMVRT